MAALRGGTAAAVASAGRTDGRSFPATRQAAPSVSFRLSPAFGKRRPWLRIRGARSSPPAIPRRLLIASCLAGDHDEPQQDHSHEDDNPLKDDDDDIDEGERRRREKIGLANKGRTPWNKGKSHSPATIARIGERIRIVMQDPKIREKLRQHSHPQSEETKRKIQKHMKARMLFEKRQLSIVGDWKERIAEAARLGDCREDELEWDSFNILKAEMRRDHYAAVKEQRQKQKVPRIRRWTAEQRQKISEGVRAKWDDPVFRERMSEGFRECRKNKQPQDKKKLQSDNIVDKQFDQLLAIGNYSGSNETRWSDSIPAIGDFTTTSVSSYCDPSSKEKLQRIKQLRLQSVKEKEPFLVNGGTTVNDHAHQGGKVVTPNQHDGTSTSFQAQREATERARLLLEEAERAARIAAQALENADSENESLKCSLLEAQLLLKEANNSISKAEAGIALCQVTLETRCRHQWTISSGTNIANAIQHW